MTKIADFRAQTPDQLSEVRKDIARISTLLRANRAAV